MIRYLCVIILFCSCHFNKVVKYNHSFGDLNSWITKNKRVYIPKGTYYINQLILDGNNIIKTDGIKTKIIQIQQDSIMPVILVTGSNVLIDSIYIEGNIDSDRGEWNHAIQLLAIGQNIVNVKLLGLYAFNIRGDVNKPPN